MVYVPTNVTDIADLASYSERQQIEWMSQAYQEQTNWFAQESIRGGGEFVRSGFSDAHFPLELIQNADDEGATAMRFERDAASNELRVYDDGDGFDLDGAVSVCQQGQSRKQSDKQIGFMGIGFKSLFEVCDRVEIHSNGYHFEFETNHGSTEDGAPGFLVPKWVDHTENVTPYQPDDDDPNEYTTVIIGHLSNPGDVIEPLQTTNLSPSVFLFLNSLKTLRIRDTEGTVNRDLGGDRGLDSYSYISELEEAYQEHTPPCEDTGSGESNWPTVEMRELSEDGEIQRYVLFRNTWKPGDVERPQFREELEQSDLFVALRVNDDGEFCEADGSVRISPIHSYLPVKQFDGIGVDFVVHADFDLTLNRQGVQQGSPWNNQIVQELREQVLEPAAKTIAEHNSLHRNLEFIVPEESGGDGLILDDLLAEFTNTLQSLNLVRIAGNADKDLVQPTDACSVSDAVTRQFSPDEIHDAVGKWPVITAQEPVLERLGVVESYDIRSVLKNASEASIVADKDTKWFSDMYQGIIESYSTTDIDDISPDNISVNRRIGKALKGDVVPTPDGDQASGEGGSTSPLRGVKVAPESGVDGWDSEEANEVISSPVADEELFTGEHGDLIRQFLIEAGAEELTNAEILAEAATDGSLDQSNITAIMAEYADDEHVNAPTAEWLRNIEWETTATTSLLKEIKSSPEPDGIVEIIETWVCENWKRIPPSARRTTLQYLFESDDVDIEQFEGKALPTEDNQWVSPNQLLFPAEFDPQYDYEELTERYPQVINASIDGFVDPQLINGNTSDCRSTLRTLGVCNKDVHVALSGDIGEEFVKRYLVESKGIELLGLNDPVGRDFEDVDGNYYEVKSATGRKNKIELDGPQAEKINHCVGSETDYTLITVAYSLNPDQTEIQDQASAETIVSQRDEIVYKP